MDAPPIAEIGSPVYRGAYFLFPLPAVRSIFQWKGGLEAAVPMVIGQMDSRRGRDGADLPNPFRTAGQRGGGLLYENGLHWWSLVGTEET